MLAINIDNPEIEHYLKEEVGDNQSLVKKFVEFIQHQKIKQDVEVSNKEFEEGDFMDIEEAFARATNKYATPQMTIYRENLP
jgi:hypothetical protein